ncbi:outer membrane beta-barrel protein [Aquamicrobium sp. LC103]|uniref:outer membrane protein n=1 Tax=Aquamicrobium sp. LC103 TaxID=1120658 RepID=UPI00069BE6C8|nr:outer membrane beta-barrel protein [Aquamicrobium sp. LC103]TKT75353.1 porin family protein [Aquamicrobium sp. LC103]
MMKFVRPLLGGVALLAGSAMPVLAADLYEPPVIEYEPEPVAFGGWYLRGHIGMSNQRVDSLYNVLFDDIPGLAVVDKNFEAGPIGGIGAGYQFNKWLRVDGVVEYRGEVGFHGLDLWNDGVDDRFNKYSAKKSEWLLMANAYADLGEFRGITPYIGAGIGASRNTIHSFRDEGIDPFGSPTLAYADSASKWNFAWALHAGVGIKATERMTIDLGYSFLNLGDAKSGDIVAYDGTNNVDNPMHFRDITSHDFKLGVRYSFY